MRKKLQKRSQRSSFQRIVDFIFFPIRAVTLFEDDRWGLSSLRTERFDYVASEVSGRCLDVGCGRGNLFINTYCGGEGVGIDVFEYDGLTRKNIVKDMTKLPFKSKQFDTVTFIANINHIPKPIRDKELAESYRVLKENGKIIVTMGNPISELIVHKVVYFYDKIFGTNHDMDSERGMEKDEEYYLTDDEIVGRLTKAKYTKIKKRYFLTQWGFNHMFIAYK